jgi:hypothetical protein
MKLMSLANKLSNQVSLANKQLPTIQKKGDTMSNKFKSLEELKQFVIAEKIAQFENQKAIENKLFATLKKEGK